MSFSLRSYKMHFFCLWGAVLLAGCASSSPKTSSSPATLVLSDSIIAANKGDVDGLYNSWINPFINSMYQVQNVDAGQLSANEVAVKDGFGRFCSSNGGVLTHKTEKTQNLYNCSMPDGTFIGAFNTVRYASDNMLGILYSSPLTIKKHEEELKSFKARKKQNGPTGEVVTKEGRFKFIRIGNLKERDDLIVDFQDGTKERPSIEEFVKIEFPEMCCNFHEIFSFRDGQKKSTRRAIFFSTTDDPGHIVSYGSWRFVLIDSESGEPYTRIFDSFDVFQISFEEKEVWSAKKLDVISTQFDNSPARINAYTKRIRAEANQLYVEAKTKGWLNLLPDGKFTPQLVSHLHYKLNNYAKKKCQENASNGITSLEGPLRCKVAARELELVMGKGYLLDLNATPLSSIIVLNKIKKDMLSLGDDLSQN